MKTSKLKHLLLPATALLITAACGDGDLSSVEKEEGVSSVSGSIEAGADEAGKEDAPSPAETELSASAGETGNAARDSEAAPEEEQPDSSSVTVSGITPEAVEIPAIGVYADIESLGLTDTGAMDVPDDGDLVGWYNRGAKPGSTGNAVLAGHVDDREGPAVFFDLKDLTEGDEITVHGEDGPLVFTVTGMESYPYDDAPLQKIFGRSSDRNLNLITCTGEFDREQRTHRERLVVFTELNP
ncbi:class F sortase [Alteribacter natronophilus]|uniref:class F sortase n=1 Tax=Alteribacter natronophilus TaxID=2583810 RepID=UPI0014864209|nr:class F sortase [Alteribacter natronophilus]